MNRPICNVVRHNASALALFHKQVHRKVLHKEDAVVPKGSSEQRVQHRVTRSVSNSTAAVGLTTLAKLTRLPSKGSLVDFAFCRAREGHSVGFEFANSNRGFSRHVLDSVLVTQPVRSLHCVIEVPSPVVFVHVAKSSIDSSLYKK